MKGKAGRVIPLVVAVAFVAVMLGMTILERMPLLERPMAGIRHGEGTARVLRHMQIWDEVGLAETHFMMRTTHTNPADAYVADVGYLTAGDGIYYYASFPPLFPLAPYLVFKTLGVPIGIDAVRWFNMGLQILGAAAVFLLVRRAARSFGATPAAVAAAAGATVYAISPVLLWYHSNAYVTASLGTPLFALSTYLAVRLWDDEEPARWLWWAFAASAAALTYTEWLGVTFTMGVLGLAAVRWRDARARKVAFATVAATGAVLLITLAQYSSIAGVAAFIDGIGGKLALRTGLTEASHHSVTSLRSWSYVVSYYEKGYLPVLQATAGLVFAAGVGLLARRVAGSATVIGRDRALGTALWLATVPVALHHLLLFSHTAVHDFDIVKSAVPMGLIAGAACAVIWSTPTLTRWAKVIVLIGLALLAQRTFDAGMAMSSRRDFGIDPGPRDVGRAIVAYGVAPDEVVFIEGDAFYTGSAASYYAGFRNLVRYTPERAATIMHLNGASGGVLFTVDEKGREVIGISRVAPDGSLEATAAR